MEDTFTFTVKITDSVGQDDTQDLSINVTPLSITTPSLPSGSIGQVYDQTIQTVGGVGALNFTISQGSLPAGLTLSQTTGVISGTPTLPVGTSSFTVRVQDSGGQNATKALSITISLFNVPNITTTTLQGGTVGKAYSQPVVATGGIGVLTWSISAGTLPQGLNINPINGVISGTPTNEENSNFTVRVTDTLNQSDTPGSLDYHKRCTDDHHNVAATEWQRECGLRGNLAKIGRSRSRELVGHAEPA